MQVGQSQRNQRFLTVDLCSYVIYLSFQNEGTESLVVYSLSSTYCTSFPFDILVNSFDDSSLRSEVLEAVQL